MQVVYSDILVKGSNLAPVVVFKPGLFCSCLWCSIDGGLFHVCRLDSNYPATSPPKALLKLCCYRPNHQHQGILTEHKDLDKTYLYEMCQYIQVLERAIFNRLKRKRVPCYEEPGSQTERCCSFW